jgi:hypothetical protein
MKLRYAMIFILLSLFLLVSCNDAEVAVELPDIPENIEEFLATIPGATFELLETQEPFAASYKVMLEQPIDHNNPEAGTFQQRIFVSHADRSQPMVLRTDGYTAGRARTSEITRLLGGNQLHVEYRFFGQSAPEVMDWQYLTIEQAANDHHRIRELFGAYYGGKWVATGHSKGGQSSLYYKTYFPNDVAATVAYVAPLPNAQEDSRIWDFINNVGEEECRQKLRDFQIILLENKAEVIKLLAAEAEEKEEDYSMLGLGGTIDYAACEYPFAYWQYHNTPCDEIPVAGATPAEMLSHLRRVVPFYLYEEKALKGLLPAFYQFVTEIGYYGFERDHIQHLLTDAPNPTNVTFGPKDTDLSYRPEGVQKVRDFLDSDGNNIIYIYGEVDTWSACAYQPTEATNALYFVLSGVDHGASIAKMTEEDSAKAIAALEEWLEVEIQK